MRIVRARWLRSHSSVGSVATVERTIGPQSGRRLERERNVLLTVNIAADAPESTVYYNSAERRLYRRRWLQTVIELRNLI